MLCSSVAVDRPDQHTHTQRKGRTAARHFMRQWAGTRGRARLVLLVTRCVCLGVLLVGKDINRACNNSAEVTTNGGGAAIFATINMCNESWREEV